MGSKPLSPHSHVRDRGNLEQRAAEPAADPRHGPRHGPSRARRRGPVDRRRGGDRARPPPAGDRRPVARRAPADALARRPLRPHAQRRNLQSCRDPRASSKRRGRADRAAGAAIPTPRPCSRRLRTGAWTARSSVRSACSHSACGTAGSASSAWSATASAKSRSITAGSGGDFVFASELKAIREHPRFDAPIDRRALRLFTQRAYIPAPLSIYRGIFKLEPGCVLELDREAARRPLAEPPAVGSSGGGADLLALLVLPRRAAGGAGRPDRQRGRGGRRARAGAGRGGRRAEHGRRAGRRLPVGRDRQLDRSSPSTRNIRASGCGPSPSASRRRPSTKPIMPARSRGISAPSITSMWSPRARRSRSFPMLARDVRRAVRRFLADPDLSGQRGGARAGDGGAVRRRRRRAVRRLQPLFRDGAAVVAAQASAAAGADGGGGHGWRGAGGGLGPAWPDRAAGQGAAIFRGQGPQVAADHRRRSRP